MRLMGLNSGRPFICVLYFFLFFALTNLCTINLFAQDPIIGTWRLKTYELNGCVTDCPGSYSCSSDLSIFCNTQTYRFYSDGTFYRHEYNSEGTTVKQDGTWLLSGSTLTLTIDSQTDSVEVQVAQNTLIMIETEPDETHIATYERINSCSQNGDSMWLFYSSKRMTGAPAVGNDGTVYIGSEDYYLYAINPDSTLKWRFKTNGAIQQSAALGVDGTIYAVSMDGNLYAINSDGTQKWNYTFTGGSSAIASPAISNDGSIVVRADTSLYAISPNGDKLWNAPVTISSMASPVIDASGNIYISSDGYFMVFKSDGSQKLKIGVTGSTYSSIPTINFDGTIYFATTDNTGSYYFSTLYAFNPIGSTKWTYELYGHATFPPTIGIDGTIYINAFSNVYAINPDGTNKWILELDAGTLSGTPSIAEGGTVYVRDSETLWAINENDRNIIYETEIQRAYTTMQFTTISDTGTIYLGSYYGLQAICGDSKSANSPWPLYRHNPRNTGLQPIQSIANKRYLPHIPLLLLDK